MDTFEISQTFDASAEAIYMGWLDSDVHAGFGGGAAEIDPRVGGRFVVGDKYISGVTTALEPYKRIVQSWRTNEFASSDADSQLEIILEELDASGDKARTKLILRHSNLPAGKGDYYKKGWVDYYFNSMAEYFKAA